MLLPAFLPTYKTRDQDCRVRAGSNHFGFRSPASELKHKGSVRLSELRYREGRMEEQW